MCGIILRVANLRILVWAESVGGPAPLDAAAEVELLRDVERVNYGLEVISYVDRPVEDLATVIGSTAHEVFHFVGHASIQGELLLHGAVGEIPVPTRDLRLLLSEAPGDGPAGVV